MSQCLLPCSVSVYGLKKWSMVCFLWGGVLIPEEYEQAYMGMTGILPGKRYRLGHSHYILRMTSPPMMMSWNCVRREKKRVASSAFFLFFPPTC